ncbi:MAG TPA: DUF6798 domain-containing protein, partial [Gemmata sp.]|nr:DUF6798 domain-containing protein [Gemmata sp.]
AFAAAHTQSPLYYSNQNQYLLHGLAEGGLGHLSHDWLAKTTDPTPVFSAMVAAMYRSLGDWSFQAAYFLMLMLYFLSMRFLVNALPGVPDTRTFRMIWAAGFIAAHAAVLRVASVALTGVDYPWYFQAGLASQYLLGPGLQPSAFGFLLVTAIAAFANRRPVLACGLAALPCAFHATYLLPAGLLVLGFLVSTFREDETAGPRTFAAMLSASVVFVPVAAWTLFTFGPENEQTFLLAQRILAETRIPHHCVITRWFDLFAELQLAWIALGLLLLWRSGLLVALLIPTVFGVALSLVQYQTGNPTLALAFPWRISVVLVPVATAVFISRIARLVPANRAVEFAAGSLVLALAAGGVWVMADGKGYRTNDAENATYGYLRAHAGPNDVYLLPVKIPEVGTGRGAVSNTFTPPPRQKPGTNQIPVDWQRFRLHSGACLYVDFKSVPYKDSEVLEWLRRMKKCEEWYQGDWNASNVRHDLMEEGVTHVIATRDHPIKADYLEEVLFNDPNYLIYRVK